VKEESSEALKTNIPDSESDNTAITHAKASGRTRFPAWLRKRLPPAGHAAGVSANIADKGLHTVCVEAKCPNRAECYSCGTATFLIMGNVCTRSCGFCGVGHGKPLPLDPLEPPGVAESARALGLRHIVITSVTRDDLSDGGAGHFVRTVEACRSLNPASTIEILVPDFNGSDSAIALAFSCRPEILNHNAETVPRLYSRVRPQADYRRSLALLSSAARQGLTVKSGFMVGLGETEEEVLSLLKDVRATGCSIVTIGQYLQPSAAQLPVESFVSPEQFARYEEAGKRLGFTAVVAGPFVRSSYHAREVFEKTGPQRSAASSQTQKASPDLTADR
jgi:lipoic acid synthetase